MNANTQQAQLVSFIQIDEYSYGLRFSTPDRELFSEIVDTIKSFRWQLRRWNPELFGEKGGWQVDEQVLEELYPYFPSLKHRKRALNAYEAIRNRARPDNR